MKTIISLISLYILTGCGSTPRGIVDEGPSSAVAAEKPLDENPDDTLFGGTGSTEEKFTVSFPGGAFSGGAITGEGIDCNRTSSDICSKDFAAGSPLRFEMPKTISANGQTLTFSGKIQCNGEESTIAAIGSVVVFEIPSLDKNYSCSFHFAP